MYALTAVVRKSRRADRPGCIVVRIRDKEGAERMFSTGIVSTDEELRTSNRDAVLKWIKSLYDVVEQFHDGSEVYSIDDIAAAFRNKSPEEIAAVEIADFRVRRDVASVGKPFNAWINYVKSDKERYFDGKRLIIQSLTSYITYLLEEDASLYREGTVNSYKSTRNVLAEFLCTWPDGKDVIDGSFIMAFRRWLSDDRNLTNSTVSFYLSTLRAILNRAREGGFIDMPGGRWFTGLIENNPGDETTGKSKALDKGELNSMAKADVSDDPLMEFSRDLFMFSFYCRGMELIDILSLRRGNICGDMIVFNKRLAGREQVIKLEPAARRLIAKYDDHRDGVLFSAIRNFTSSNEYNTFRRIIAPKLAELGKQLGIRTPLIFSAARTTWLEMARESDLASLMLE